MLEIDELDRKVVDLLIGDGRLTAAEIARSLGNVTERTVRYRLDRLIRERVIKIGAIVNPKALGYNVLADVFLEVESGSIDEVAQAMLQHDCVTYIACSIGESDISIQIVGKDNADIYAFVRDVLGRTPKIRRTQVSILPIKLKDVYEWRIPEKAVSE